VLVFFARRTLDAEVALDLTAQTFAQAWRGWARVRPSLARAAEEVRAWLLTIARRQLSNRTPECRSRVRASVGRDCSSRRGRASVQRNGSTVRSSVSDRPD
jgi:DNA-directed RNA polymerase specialized sigma24 family protein